MGSKNKILIFYNKLISPRKNGSNGDVFLQYYKNYNRSELLFLYSKFDVSDPISILIRNEIYDRKDPLHRLAYDVVFYFINDKIKKEVVAHIPKDRRKEFRNDMLKEVKKINDTYATRGSEELTKSHGNLTCVKMKHSINERLHYFIYDEKTAVFFRMMHKSSTEYTSDEIETIKSEMKILPKNYIKNSELSVMNDGWINESADFDEEFVKKIIESIEQRMNFRH